MSNIIISPQSGIIEFNTGAASGSSFFPSDAPIRLEGSGVGVIRADSGIFASGITVGGNPVMTGVNPFDEDTLQSVTDRGAITTNNLEIQGAGSKSFTVDSTDGHASVVIDRHSTSYDANLSFQTNGATKWRLWNDSNDSTFSIRDEVNASNVMTWEVGGNVGIGTDDPDANLEIKKVANDAFVKVSTDGAGAWFQTDSTNQQYQGFKVGHNWFMGQYASNDFVIKNGLQSNGTAVLTIQDTTDNVGIGTNNPSHTLDVESADETVASFNSTDNKCAIALNDDDTTVYVSAENSRGAFGFQAGLHANNLNIDTAGEVGIGTHTPTHRLHVRAEQDGDWVTRITNTEATAGSNYGLKVDGGSNSSDVAFEVSSLAGSSYLHVRGDGNVGIGTTNPVSKLTVESTANALADVDEPENHHLLLRNPANDTTEGVGMGFLVSAATNDVGAAIVCKRIGNNAQSELQFWNKQNTTVDGVITQSMTIAEDGNVGIGTTNPAQKLEIASSLDQVRITDSDGTNQYFELGHNNGSTTYVSRNNSAHGTHVFYTNNGSSTERMRISAAGNVGINYTDPQSKLDVKLGGGNSAEMNSTGLNNLLTLRVGNNEDPASVANAGAKWGMRLRGFVNDTSNPNRKTAAVYAVSEDAGAGYNRKVGMALHTSPFDADHVERVRIDCDGNVGIGTTNPLSKLDVKHQIRVRDSSSNDTHALLDSNGTDGRLRINNGSNWGLIARGFENSPAIGAYNLGNLRVVAFSTSDGANISSELARFDFANSSVGIGTNTPSSQFYNNLVVGNNSAGEKGITIRSNSSNGGHLAFSDTDSDDAGRYAGRISYFHDTNKMQFFTTAGDHAMTINNAQKVGIGTTNPSSALTVVGGGSDAVLINDGYVRIKDTSTNKAIQIQPNVGNEARIAASNFDLGQANPLKIAGDAIRFTTSGAAANTEVMRLTADGKVGIGSNNPTSPLTFNAAAVGLDGSAVTTMTKTIATTNIGVKLGFNGGSNSNNNIIGGLSMGNVGEEYAGMYAVDGGASATTHLAFFAGNATSTNEGIKLLSDGKVGIGSATPAYKLDVAGDIQAKDSAVFAGTQGSRGYSFHDLGTGWGFKGLTSNARLGVLVQGVESMTFENNGRVGIGSTDPALYKLEVAGDISTDRYIRHNGDTNTYFGFSSDDTIQFNTNSSERMRITSAGNVGIGTDNPQKNLDIQGQFMVRPTSNTTVGRVLIGSTASDAYLELKDASSNNKVFLNTDGDSYFDGGNVGIGLTDPSHSLSVGTIGNANGKKITTYLGGADEDYSAIGGQRGQANAFCSSEIRFINEDNSAGKGAIAIAAGTNTLSEHLRVTSAGNVGIGTSNPAAFLDVSKDNSNAGNQFVVADTEGATAAIRGYLTSDPAGLILNHYYAEGGSSNEYARYADFVANVGNGAATKMRFITKNAANVYSTGLLIDNNGNVGIGTTDPAYKLDVVDSNGGILARFKDSDSSHAGLLIQGDTNGGSITNASAFTSEVIYLQNNLNAIRFYTDGTEAVRIDSSQRVGIGTNSILGMLQVNGRALIEGPTVPSTITISDSGDATKALRLGYEPTWDVGSISASDYGAGWKNIVIAPHAGKVGIGTTSPHQPLSVKGTIVSYNSSYVQVAGMTNSSNNGRLYANNSAGITKVLLDTNGVSYFLGGNVGIGVNDPDEKLEVQGKTHLGSRGQDGGASIEYASFSETNGGASTILGNAVYAGTANNTYRKTRSDNGNFIALNYNKGITFHTHVTGSASSTEYDINQHEQMRLTTGGLLGVGTDAPESKLHVAGGDIRVDNAKSILGETNGGGNFQMVKIDTSDNMLIGDGNLVIDINGTSERMKIESAGNVRIGTNTNFPAGTAAGGKLDIRGASDGQLVIASDGGSQDIKASYNLELWADYDNNNSAGYSNIIFKTDGDNERVRIDNAGNVGIGTTAPAKLLDIDGDTRVKNAELQITSSAGFTTHLNYEDGGNNYISQANGGATFFRNNGGTLMFLNSAGDFGVDSDTLYVDASTDRVGINTNSPDSSLSIVNTAGIVGMNLKAAADNICYIDFGDSSDNNIGGINYSNTDDTLNFRAGNTNRVTINSAGNVGIGTNNPTHELDVVGEFQLADTTSNSTNKVARIRNRHYTNTEEPMSLIFATSTSSTNVVQFGGGTNTENAATDCVFYTAANNTTIIGTERVRIDSDGNVSIGAGSNNHAGTRVHIQGPDTSPSTSTTAIDDCTLVLGNSDVNYGTVFATKSNGNGQIQQRRMASAVYYALELNPHGGNVGIGTENPSDKLQVNGSFSASSKTFNIEHPTQSGKRLIHGCFEGPEHGVYFRGKTQDSGIQAPEYWSGLVDIDSMTVDVTPIGANQSIYVDRIEDNGDVYVGANTDEPLNYFYIIYGERKDIDKLEVVKDPPPAPPEIS